MNRILIIIGFVIFCFFFYYLLVKITSEYAENIEEG